MISEFTGKNRILFFPKAWANAVCKWISGIHSPSGTIRIKNTLNPGDAGSLQIDVNVDNIVKTVKSRLGFDVESPMNRNTVRDTVFDLADGASIINSGRRLAVSQTWLDSHISGLGLGGSTQISVGDGIQQDSEGVVSVLCKPNGGIAADSSGIYLGGVSAGILKGDSSGSISASATITMSEVDGLETALSDKADAGHAHSEYALVAHAHAEYAVVGHGHDYSATYALKSHTHDYSSTYAAKSHTHSNYLTSSNLKTNGGIILTTDNVCAAGDVVPCGSGHTVPASNHKHAPASIGLNSTATTTLTDWIYSGTTNVNGDKVKYANTSGSSRLAEISSDGFISASSKSYASFSSAPSSGLIVQTSGTTGGLSTISIGKGLSFSSSALSVKVKSGGGISLGSDGLYLGMTGNGFVKCTSGSLAVASIAISDVTDLQTTLGGFASTSHNHDSNYAAKTHAHTIDNVTDLQSTLDGKASSSHSHSTANITNWSSATSGFLTSASISDCLKTSDISSSQCSSRMSHKHWVSDVVILGTMGGGTDLSSVLDSGYVKATMVSGLTPSKVVETDTNGRLCASSSDYAKSPSKAPTSDKVLTCKSGTTSLTWEDAGGAPSDPGTAVVDAVKSGNVTTTTNFTNTWTYSSSGTNGLSVSFVTRLVWTGTVLKQFYRTAKFDKNGRLYSLSAESSATVETPTQITWA